MAVVNYNNGGSAATALVAKCTGEATADSDVLQREMVVEFLN